MISAVADRAANLIFKADLQRDPAVQKLSASELISWIKEQGSAEILKNFEFAEKGDADKCRITLEVIEVVQNSVNSPVKNLALLWEFERRSPAKMKSEIRDSIEGLKADRFFLPHMPGHRDVGHVVDLRRPITLRSGQIFIAEADAKLASAGPEAYIRMGRFTDYIRFSVSQSFAFLFSRIGMISRFEEDSDIAREAIVEEFIQGVVS